MYLAKTNIMKRHGSLTDLPIKNKINNDEEGLIYEESKGFNISPKNRRK